MVYKLDDGHGGHDYTAALHRQNKAGRDQIEHLGRISSYPERDGAKSETGGATKMLVDGHSEHSRTMVVGGDAPAIAVVKWSNQQDIKHHGITEKLKQCFPRSEAHRRVLATTALARRGLCRPRGRRAWSASSRRSQASRMVWLSA